MWSSYIQKVFFNAPTLDQCSCSYRSEWWAHYFSRYHPSMASNARSASSLHRLAMATLPVGFTFVMWDAIAMPSAADRCLWRVTWHPGKWSYTLSPRGIHRTHCTSQRVKTGREVFAAMFAVYVPYKLIVRCAWNNEGLHLIYITPRLALPKCPPWTLTTSMMYCPTQCKPGASGSCSVLRSSGLLMLQ